MIKIPLHIKKKLTVLLPVNFVAGKTLGCNCCCYSERSSLLYVYILAVVKYAIDFGLDKKFIVDFYQKIF